MYARRVLAARRRATAAAVALAAVAVAVAASRWLGRARIADDYDGIGFVRALVRFDVAALQPHFPGYPVYVALGRVATHLGLPPLAAATAVSSLAAGATAAAVWRLAAAGSGGRPKVAWLAMALYAAAWLPWLEGGAARSDATATAFVTLAFAALTWDGAVAAALGGAAIALTLGTRASYWPLTLSFAVVAARRPRRAIAATGFVVTTAAWLVPFVAAVGGARALWGLGRTHVTGHFTAWGGSIVTRPDLVARAGAFVRGLVYDGLFAHVAALAVALAAVAFVVARRGVPPLPWRLALVVGAPYAAWVFFGQNVVEQPRHLLPLVTLGCVALALVLADAPRALAVAVPLVALAASLPLVVARVRVPPAAAQAARWTATTYAQPDTVVVFGGRSMRFYDELAPGVLHRPRTWLSEVDVELERLDVLPPSVLVTSEVDADARRARRLVDVARFCRDPRLDRGQPCLTLRRYTIGR